MQKYTIVSNEYLNKDTDAYFRCDYLGFEKQNNPDYINILKNTFGKENYAKLQEAKNLVKSNLHRELSHIIRGINDEDIVICTVPRSKRTNSYINNQLLFAKAVAEVLPLISVDNKNIIDGTSFINRHTDTATTHLRNTEYIGNGDLPYPGITRNTCNISNQIIGKHIILVDDIYTKGVNIDEDVIQCLLDSGASDVTFVSIARTPHSSFSRRSSTVLEALLASRAKR